MNNAQENLEVLLDHKNAQANGASAPIYASDLLGGSTHAENLQQMVGETKNAAEVLGQTISKPFAEQGSIYNDTINFTYGFALERDYKTRYASSSKLRYNALSSTQHADYLRSFIAQLAVN